MFVSADIAGLKAFYKNMKKMALSLSSFMYNHFHQTINNGNNNFYRKRRGIYD
jgi:hypothetical protein